MCEDEAKERQSLMGRFRNLEHEYDGKKGTGIYKSGDFLTLDKIS